MANSRTDETMYLGPFATPETFNASTLYRPGELGKRYVLNSREYQRVQLDSGATASTGAGVVAAGQLAFWKDRGNYIVTNDKTAAVGGPVLSNARNGYAGVFGSAITAGYFCDIQQRGRMSAVVTDSGTAAVNDMLTPHTAATAGAVVVAQGTAPTVNPVGRARAATSASLTDCILGGWDVVEIP